MYKEALKNIRHGLNSTSGDEENYDIITATGNKYQNQKSGLQTSLP